MSVDYSGLKFPKGGPRKDQKGPTVSKPSPKKSKRR